MELGLTEGLCLCKRRGGRRQPGSPGQHKEVAARESWGDAGGSGVWSWERRCSTFTLSCSANPPVAHWILAKLRRL